MISFKPLLKTNRKTGLAFAQNGGLALQVRSFTDNHFHWQQFISFADIEPNHKPSHPGIPKVAGWILIIPAYQCITKYAVLPSVDPAEIEKMLEYELPNVVSYNTQPWTWDFSIINQQEDGTSRIMIVLSPLTIIDRHIKTLFSLGIKPNIVTTGAVFYTSLLKKAKALPESDHAGCFLLNDDYMDFFVIENEQAVFLRGVQLKKELRENTRLIQTEIQRSSSMVKEYGFTNWPDKFFAINANNSAADFVKIIERVPGISVKEIESAGLYNEHSSIIDSRITISLDDSLPSTPEKTQFNLLPRHLKEKHKRSNKRKQMALHALRFCFVLFLAFLCLKVSIWRKSCLLERCEQRLAAISPMAEKLQFLQQQLSIIENQLQGNISTLDIISELYRVLPKDITVHYLSIEQNKRLVTRAQAKLLSQAFDCIGPLEKSDYFTNVRQSYANQRRIENSVLIDFEIAADLRKGRHKRDIK